MSFPLCGLQKPPQTPFWNEGCVACLRPPSASRACQDAVRIPARSPQLLSASSACTLAVRLGQVARPHAEQLESLQSVRQPPARASCARGSAHSFLAVESHGLMGKTEAKLEEELKAHRRSPQTRGHQISSLQPSFPFPLFSFPSSSPGL